MDKHVASLNASIIDLIEFYSELDDVGHERFLNMFHDQLNELITYHGQQIDKLRGLKERLAGNNSVSLDDNTFNDWTNFNFEIKDDLLNTDTIEFVGDDNPHSDYYWDYNRNK